MTMSENDRKPAWFWLAVLLILISALWLTGILTSLT